MITIRSGQLFLSQSNPPPPPPPPSPSLILLCLLYKLLYSTRVGPMRSLCRVSTSFIPLVLIFLIWHALIETIKMSFYLRFVNFGSSLQKFPGDVHIRCAMQRRLPPRSLYIYFRKYLGEQINDLKIALSFRRYM